MSLYVVIFWASIMAALVAAVGCGYLIAAAILLRRFAQRRIASNPRTMPAVTILKPLNGEEPGLLDNLASFCRQNYRGDVQIIFGVQDPNDRAIAVVEKLRNLEGGRALDLVIETKLHGLNRKVSNLINMAQHIRHEVVVLADSDMRVDPDYLARVVAALEDSAGAVTCLYYGVAAAGIWANLCALAINMYFIPGVVVALALGWTPCFGSTIALRREMLAAIGGFAPFVNNIADDYALGQALREHGCKVSVPPFAVAHVCTSASADELWRQELRWGRTIRSIDPRAYAGSAFAYPLPWALIAALMSGGSAVLAVATGIAVIAIACRIALLRQVEQAFGLPAQAYWLVPVRDLLSFIVFVLSFVGRDVSWRGRRYRMVFAGSWADQRAHSP